MHSLLHPQLAAAQQAALRHPMTGVERRHGPSRTPARRRAVRTSRRVALLAPVVAITLTAPAHGYLDTGQTAPAPAQPIPVMAQQPPIPLSPLQPPIPIRP
jgi:hypothetical protein